jgi:hypothetical protein
MVATYLLIVGFLFGAIGVMVTGTEGVELRLSKSQPGRTIVARLWVVSLLRRTLKQDRVLPPRTAAKAFDSEIKDDEGDLVPCYRLDFVDEQGQALFTVTNVVKGWFAARRTARLLSEVNSFFDPTDLRKDYTFLHRRTRSAAIFCWCAAVVCLGLAYAI